MGIRTTILRWFRPTPGRAKGFTLVELMVTMVVLSFVVVGLGAVLYGAMHSKVATTNSAESSQAARTALDMIAYDVRSAGYDADLDYTPNPQPAIAYVDSLQVLISVNEQPFPDTSGVKGWPLAYNPASSPKPAPFAGTSWEPPIRYRTGAETVRWTLDVNNDGFVDANDKASPEAADAQHSPNPDDYVLIRQVYGDSTNGAAGSNGPKTERISLVLRPGGTVPPLFTVYLNGSTQPWNWSSGPVPASRLRDIRRIVAQVTAPSGKPDNRGRYAQTVYRTDISSLRNTPRFGTELFGIDGYVFDDQNSDGTRDEGEPGLPGAFVTLGPYSTTTSASGYFLFQVPARTYTLRHVPPMTYGVLTSPDSFVVTVGPPVTRSFADTLRNGGWVTATVYRDDDNSGTRDEGEEIVENVALHVTPGTAAGRTGPSGTVTLFASTGSYSVTCTPPDSFVVTTLNPVPGTMSSGGSASISFGVLRAPNGTIAGTVFRDSDKNGVMGGGESGIAGVYVGVVKDADQRMMGYTYTDGSGNYSIDVPLNDPPHTSPYSVFCLPPNGFFPTTPTSISDLWIVGNDLHGGRNFGLSSFQVISIEANRILSVASRDLIENDWGTTPANAMKDSDIMLGADAIGADQISVWFNQYSSSPLFSAGPTYTRSAPAAVLAMALDTLDSNAPRSRPDLVTGTTWTTAGNFFVWITQNSTSNEGYFPATYTTKLNYTTQDKGDVQAVLTGDIAGGDAADMPDIIVGTKSPTAGHGTVEVWRNDNKANPQFGRQDVFPDDGGVPAGGMGEVTSMSLADLNGDGRRDLVVGTRTGIGSGQILVLRSASEKKSEKPHFSLAAVIVVPDEPVMAVATLDVNGDGRMDIVAGTESGTSSGSLLCYRSDDPSVFSYLLPQKVDAGANVLAIRVADLGGGAGNDLAVGLRSSTAGYGGGLRIYYLDGGAIPSFGTDPSGGTVVNMVPALTSGNFNYGTSPLPAAPYWTDIAAGVKSSAATGQLVVFIR